MLLYSIICIILKDMFMSSSDDDDGIFGFPTIFVILMVIFFWGDPDIHDKTMAWIDRQDGKSCELPLT